MAKRKNKKRNQGNQETPKIVKKVEVLEVPSVVELPSTEVVQAVAETFNETTEVVEVVPVVEDVLVTTTVAPTTTKAPLTPLSSEKAKNFLQNVQEKQIEQIHDWLDSIEESMLLTKDILINTTNNQEESFALKRIQKLYHQLNLIKNIKKGKTVIMGYNKKKLNN